MSDPMTARSEREDESKSVVDLSHQFGWQRRDALDEPGPVDHQRL